jgi:hypothetical protein
MRILAPLIICYFILFLNIAHALMIPEHDHELMIKKLQNPIARMTTVPVFYDADFDIKEGMEPRQAATLRPVVPAM